MDALHASYPFSRDMLHAWSRDDVQGSRDDSAHPEGNGVEKARMDPSYRGSRKTNRAAPQQVRSSLIDAVRAKIEKGHYNSTNVIDDLSDSMARVFNERR